MHQDEFVLRHIGPSESETNKMLASLEVDSIEELLRQTIPQEIRLMSPLSLSKGISENKFLKELRTLSNENKEDDNVAKAIYDYEPDEETILKDLLPKNVSIQIFKVLLESDAGEHGARMAAMDNATRNAGEMIDGLTLKYNRTRQAFITKELIEIISGAELV